MLTSLTLERVTLATGVELEAWSKDVVSLDRKAKAAKDELTGSMFDAGLVVYGVKRHHRTLQDQAHVGSTTPWSATWKRLTGTDKPTPRATTMALAIEAFVVEGKHLTEPELRACPVDSAETAVGIYRDAGSMLAHAAVIEAATLIKGYSGPKTDKERKGIITALKALRRSLKPSEPMDADEARAKVQEVLKANPMFTRIVAAELVATLRYLPEEGREDNLHAVWSQFQLADDVWPAESVDEWLTAAEPGTGTTQQPAPTTTEPMPVNATEPTPVVTDAAVRGWTERTLPPGATPEAIAKVTSQAREFATAHNRVPANLVELVQWKKAQTAAVAA